MKILKYLLTIFKYSEKDQLMLKLLNVKLKKSHVKSVSKLKTLPITVHKLTKHVDVINQASLPLPCLRPSQIVNYEFF